MRIFLLLLLMSSNAFAVDKRMFMIKSGVVENIAVWDGVKEFHPIGFTLVEFTNGMVCDIGYSYSNGHCTAPVVQDEESDGN